MQDEPVILKFTAPKRKSGGLSLAFADIWKRIKGHQEKNAVVAEEMPMTETQDTIPLQVATVADGPAPAAQTLGMDEIVKSEQTTNETVRRFTLITSIHNSEAAKLNNQIAELLLTKADLEVKTAESSRRRADEELLRIRTQNRPSMVLGPALLREDSRWTATFGQFVAYGDTPDQAYDNFDFHWVNG
jgi:hypothetical protein